METQNTLDSQDLPKQLVMPPGASYRSSETPKRLCSETCRHFLSAVIAKEGATWRALPKVYGNWNAIYRRFSRWCDAGVFQALQNIFMMRAPSQVSSLIPRSCGHMSAAGAPKKKEDKTRTNSRRIYDETESFSQRPVSRCVLF